MKSAKTFEDRVLDEVRPGLEVFRHAFGSLAEFTVENMPAIRAHLDPMFQAGCDAAPKFADIEMFERRTTAEGADLPAVDLRIYRPRSAKTPLACLYWIHGGGMVVGAARFDDGECSAYAHHVGCVVVSVEYRLAPEHPYPRGVEDCYHGLRWLGENAASLGVDSSRIAVGGRSGGGVLAAATVLMARDRGGPPLRYQLLIYPQLDDRNNSPSAREFEDVVTWGARTNRSAWKAVLGDKAGGPDVPYHAAPARAVDLSRLPPALMQAGELEVFRDECIDYALRLMQAGVPCEMHVHPGLYHASDMFNPGAPSSVRMAEERYSALKRAFAP